MLCNNKLSVSLWEGYLKWKESRRSAILLAFLVRHFSILVYGLSAFPFSFNIMKHSLSTYSLNIPDEQYHADPAWSYSVIARYAKDGFNAISTLHDKVASTPSMEFGSLFDSILTKGKKTLDEYVISDTCPPPAEKEVFDQLLTMTDAPFYDIPSFTMEEAFSAVDYQKRWGYDAKYKNTEKYRDYYEARRTGKKVVSQVDWDDAVEMAKIFRANPYLSELFGKVSTDKKEFLYQTQYKTEWILPNGKEVTVKIMPDLLVVNHEDKTIQPVDLKTSSMPGYDFAENFVRFRYDIQAELYTDVLRLIIDKDPEYKDYVVLDYLFTDISRSDKVPVTYWYNPNNGFSFKDYTYKGWEELLMEILNYEEQNAKVPSYITPDGPNDLIALLNNKK